MNRQPLCELADLAAVAPEGAKPVASSDNCGVAIAATRGIVRRGVRGLQLAWVRRSGLRAEVLEGFAQRGLHAV